jgi:hypothetical protein
MLASMADIPHLHEACWWYAAVQRICILFSEKDKGGTASFDCQAELHTDGEQTMWRIAKHVSLARIKVAVTISDQLHPAEPCCQGFVYRSCNPIPETLPSTAACMRQSSDFHMQSVNLLMHKQLVGRVTHVAADKAPA